MTDTRQPAVNDRRLRPVWLGFWRFLGILIGWGAPTSQEVAGNWLMLVGFFVEGIVLWRVVVDQAAKDIPNSSLPWSTFISGLVPFVIGSLLFHQFVIFRNFALPREAARNTLEATPPGSGSALAKIEICPPWGNPRRWRKLVEIMLYGLFGVLTGEAGYMLTLLHEHNQNHVSTAFVWWLFGTEKYIWGLSLECVFLTCAIFICLCVMIWDLTVWASSESRTEYGPLLNQFFVNDLLSLVFWSCLCAVVTPRFRWGLGVRFDPTTPGKELLGWGAWVWVILISFSILYILVVVVRFGRGLVTLGKEADYTKARFKAI